MASQERPRTERPLTRRDGAAVRCSALVRPLNHVPLSDKGGPHNKQLHARGAAYIPARYTSRLQLRHVTG